MKSDEQLFSAAMALKRYGYMIKATAREWIVAYNPDEDRSQTKFHPERIELTRVRHFEDDGGSDSRNMEMLGRDNLMAAVHFSNEHLRGRLARETHDRFMSRG